MQKDSKRLAKLIRKIKRAAAAEAAPPARKTKGAKRADRSISAVKVKRALSPEARAKLSRLMRERWAAKRAAILPVTIHEVTTAISAPDEGVPAGV